MKRIAFLVILALAIPVAAQEKKPAKKPAARPAAHAKPSPQQIRRFNELEKKKRTEKAR